jgi:hypothetical protein
MESLRGFWMLLLPWRSAAAVLYALSAIAVLVVALLCWRRGALELRYAALLLATVLVAPHLMIYDLVILAPAFLLLGEWVLQHPSPSPALRVVLYLVYALPLLEPLTKLTHVQLSVLGFVALQALIWPATKQGARSQPAGL